jgi:hypothetical protein
MNDTRAGTRRPGRDKAALTMEREIRELGWDRPEDAETMIGMVCPNCSQQCVETALRDEVPSDL